MWRSGAINLTRRPGVDLDSFDEPYVSKLRSFLRGRGRELWALDLTSDLGVPVFAALSRRTDHPQEQILIGFGGHLDPRIALLRAVTELNQMLVWLLRDDKDANASAEIFEDSDTRNWLKTETIARQPYLIPDDSTPSRTPRAYSAGPMI